MLGAAISDTYLITVANAILLASSLIIPALLAGYLRFRFAARQLSPDFYLRRLEANELDRAEAIYQKISRRLRDIEQLESAARGSLRERLRQRAQIREQHGPEIEDLRSCAHHLRAFIVRLRRRPIERLRSWVHVLSGRFALTGSLVAYLTLLVPATVFFFFAEQPAWWEELAENLEATLTWRPVDERLFYVNGVTGALAVLVAPVLYLARRAKLYSDHRTQTRVLLEFAAANPDQLAHEDDCRSEAPYVDDAPSVEPGNSDSWFAVLGISPSATIDEVREAYKKKIKQNHPDRVQDMAPTIRSLAEAETKRLNAAYQEALKAVRAG